MWGWECIWGGCAKRGLRFRSLRGTESPKCVWGFAVLKAQRLSAVNAAFGMAVPGEALSWSCCVDIPQQSPGHVSLIPGIYPWHLDQSHSHGNFSRFMFCFLKSSPSSLQ